MPHLNVISEAVLNRLYLDEGLGMRAIADKLGCSVGKVHKYIHQYGIPVRSQQLWTDEEDAIVKKFYQELGADELSTIIAHSPKTIAQRARLLGVAKTNKTYHQWAHPEIDFLKKHYPAKGSRWCASRLHLDITVVCAKICSLGLTRINYEWLEEENTILYEHYPNGGPGACLPHLNRSCEAIKQQARKLDLLSPLHFNDEEIAFLETHYSSHGAAWCAEHLKDRSAYSVMTKANELRLFVSPETISDHFAGENNPNWWGGISREPYPWEFSPELKDKIKVRDGHRCQLCECDEDLTVHHIDYDKQNCQPDNLITLCRRCNSRVNFHRHFWQHKLQAIVLSKDDLLRNENA